jgi:hypothetical protein
MKPCWSRSSPFPSQSGRQESNLPSTAYQTVASPLGFGPKRAPCTGIEPVSPVRQTGWHASFITGQRERLAGVEPACPAWRAGAWTARPQAHGEHEQQGRKESNPLRAGWSRIALPGARPCRSSGRDRTRTCKGCSPRPVSNRVPSCQLARPSVWSCPGRARTCNRLVNNQPHDRCATGQ